MNELDDWSSYEKDYMWNPGTCDCESNKASKLDEYSDTNSCTCEKRLIGKLELECKDEMLNTTEISPDVKESKMWKSDRLIHTISLVIICLLLLAVVSICCYYYYKRVWIKNEYVLSY